ncbi:MerR family transcriptional regulator [Streptomyces sp. SID13031]|uniref:MerR family transcriptional regulator n=1 Tax=Streptomyces sp. SID13031 TaxID=2706046 RepID=UPI0013CB084F|nr:MerR family transcriptional regulator [Streptomyces sp. SID13031]NEA34906.1 MerR family transcriptional regulator [Streptomyces sp. SID13031]
MELWTLGELAERVEAALADYPGQVNGRVRAVPDQRAIRWYTTTGLIDRPAEMRGRTALYGRRHLLQLVAIKRRQAQGHTLAQIQSELAGATNESLQPIAALPTDLLASSPERAATRPSDPPVVRPGDPAEPAAAHLRDLPVPTRARFWADRLPAPHPATTATVVGAVRVADGVTVVLDQAAEVVPDLERLAAAAAPLLAELARQGLVHQPSSGDET